MIYLWSYECFYIINNLKGGSHSHISNIDDSVLRFLKAIRVTGGKSQINVTLSKYMVNILRKIIQTTLEHHPRHGQHLFQPCLSPGDLHCPAHSKCLLNACCRMWSSQHCALG